MDPRAVVGEALADIDVLPETSILGMSPPDAPESFESVGAAAGTLAEHPIVFYVAEGARVGS